MNYIELNKAIYALDATFSQNQSLMNDKNIDELFYLNFKKENPTYHYLNSLCGKTFEGEKVLVISFEQEFYQLFYKNLNSLIFKVKEINLINQIKKVLTLEMEEKIFIFLNVPQLIIEEYEMKKLIDVSLHNHVNLCDKLFEFII